MKKLDCFFIMWFTLILFFFLFKPLVRVEKQKQEKIVYIELYQQNCDSEKYLIVTKKDNTYKEYLYDNIAKEKTLLTEYKKDSL